MKYYVKSTYIWLAINCILTWENVVICTVYYRPPKIERNESYSCARTRPITEHLTLYLNGCKIPQVSKTKFLGVIIDDKLTWEDHITHIENKLKSCLAVVKRVVPFVPKGQYNNIYL